VKNKTRTFLDIPLVHDMLSDRSIGFTKRSISNQWFYEQLSPFSLVGFSASTGQIMYGEKSQLALWLNNPQSSVRTHNLADRLTKEVLFAVHDYLHIWAYQAINELMPKLGFGHAEITPANFEDFVFCHLLTETVATVGLDYWYLSQTDLSETLSMLTSASQLTTAYNRHFPKEMKQLNLSFEVYDPSFFTRLASFYTSGVFAGIELQHLKKSPALWRWMEQELLYGEKQRGYTRTWLNYISGGTCLKKQENSDGAVSLKEKWKLQLIESLGRLLWQKVVLNETIHFSKKLTSRNWQKPQQTSEVIDYRFFNLNSVKGDFWPFIEENHTHAKSFDYLFWQILFKFNAEDISSNKLALLKKCDVARELHLIQFLLQDEQPLKPVETFEALFLPN
jgi:hypothetical protein